jgi:hypothetical protein
MYTTDIRCSPNQEKWTEAYGKPWDGQEKLETIIEMAA